MKLTTVTRNSANTAMRAMALSLFPSMSWRHHGIGVLQGYVVENIEPEVRLHVWAPELVKPGMDVSGDIHDHRFDLVSHVLAGAVGHQEIFPIEDPSGNWAMLKLTHARAAKETGYHGPTEALPGRFRTTRDSMVIYAGHSYRFPRGRFHRSPVLPGIAVTCVEKHNQSTDAARILYPVAKPPIMAFEHEMDWSLVGPILQRATKVLHSQASAMRERIESDHDIR
jgi:hypothetical protein